MGYPRSVFVIVLILGCTLALAACLRPEVTSATVLPRIILPEAGTAPPALPPTPDLIPDLSCTQSSDCVLARRIDICCACDGIFNRTQVENEPRLQYTYETENYPYATPRVVRQPGECANIMCAPCPVPPFGLVCDSGQCRATQTWPEILAACPNQPPSQPVEWCYTSAAIAAAQSGEMEQAVSICEQYASDPARCKQSIGQITPSP